MIKFVENLAKQAEENPMVAIGTGAAAFVAVAKVLDAAGSIRSKNAYAKRMNNRKKSK